MLGLLPVQAERTAPDPSPAGPHFVARHEAGSGAHAERSVSYYVVVSCAGSDIAGPRGKKGDDPDFLRCGVLQLLPGPIPSILSISSGC